MLCKKNYWILILALFFLKTTAFSQSAHKLLRKADGFYQNGNFKMAEENYRKSLEKQPAEKGNFNLGNSIFQQQRYDDAIMQYSDLASKSKDNTLKSNSLYNKGNAHFLKKEYEQAVNAYKESLRLNPKDADAKINLAKAKRLLEEQQKQQNQDKNQDKKNDKKDKKNQDQNQDQQNQNQQQNQEPDKQPSKNKKQQSQQDLKKEDAKRMLQVMDEEERKVQQRMKKGNPKPSRSAKDW
jgi:Ca-activated chloride channel homolog